MQGSDSGQGGGGPSAPDLPSQAADVAKDVIGGAFEVLSAGVDAIVGGLGDLVSGIAGGGGEQALGLLAAHAPDVVGVLG